MPRRGRIRTLVLIALAISIVGCTRVKPEPEESLSLSTGRPSLSAEVVAPPSSDGTNDAPVALAMDASTESPVAPPAPGLDVASVPAAAPAAPTPEPRTITHTVGWGDTVLSLALQYGARMEEIGRVNSLDNNVIYVGQVLTIPLPSIPVGAEQYVVQPGDSLYGIAQYLGVSVDALMAANGLSNGYYLQVGQVLLVPSGGVLPTTATSVQAASVGQSRSHVVQPGDSLSSLAMMYDVAAEDIAKANNVVDANVLQVGQTLLIP